MGKGKIHNCLLPSEYVSSHGYLFIAFE